MKGKRVQGRAVHMSLRALKRAGVQLYGCSGIYVEKGAVTERGAKLYAPCYISADCHIAANAVVFPYTYIASSYIGANSVVRASTLIGAHIGDGASIGPYAFLRGNAVIGSGCRIGDFVEIKSSVIGNFTKIAHHAYVGDAAVGERVNIGCGAVFANYDGISKHKITVEDCVFIGCNCNIIAPVTIKRGAYIAAGTTLTADLEEGDFCVGRCRGTIKPHGADGRYKSG